MQKRIMVKGDYDSLAQNTRIALIRVGFHQIIFNEQGHYFQGEDGIASIRVFIESIDNTCAAILVDGTEGQIKRIKEGLVLQSGNPISEEEAGALLKIGRESSSNRGNGDINENIDLFTAVEEKAPIAALSGFCESDDELGVPTDGILRIQKKPFYKKWWFYGILILIIGVGAFVWTTMSRGNTDQPASQPTVTPVARALSTVDSNAPQAYTTELTSGNYSVGVDIPVGVYQIVAVAGQGTLDTESNALSEAMTMDSAGSNGVAAVEVLDLTQGDTLKIRGTLQLKLQSEAALVNTLTKRKTTESTHYTLESDFSYQSGVEFPAGIYNLRAIRGSGVIGTDGEFSVTENMGNTEDRTMVTEMKNIQLPQGTTLSLEGVSVELIPVGE